MENNLEAKSRVVVSESTEGPITKEEWNNLVEFVRSSQDFISSNQYELLLSAYKREGSKVLTKRQYVQMHEYSLFAATGVTRCS